MPRAGLEPARSIEVREILSLLCLPIPPPRHTHFYLPVLQRNLTLKNCKSQVKLKIHIEYKNVLICPFYLAFSILNHLK